MVGAGSGSALISLAGASSSSGDLFRLSSGSGSLLCEYCDASATQYVFNGITANGQCTFNHADVFSGFEAAIFPTGTGQCTASHSTISCGAASGFWVDGTGGQVNFGDILLVGSAQDIGPSITQIKSNWQPYGETAVAAGGSNRGTASFDFASFTVTDGFVQIIGGSPAGSFPTDSGTATPLAGVLNILGGPGVTTSAVGNTITVNSVVWTDVANPVTVTSDSGSIDTAGGTVITLPAAPNRGEEVRIISVLAGTVVTANAGQQIQIGNVLSSVGGTATGTANGDTLYLTWSPSGGAWFSLAATGNWLLA
jgi:hypothetical protein